MNTVARRCPACERDGLRPQGDYGRFRTLVCSSCGHMVLDRAEVPVEPDDYRVADGAALRKMLKSTRDEEFRTCAALVSVHAREGTWLDVGCSFGWFLQQIEAKGFEPYGVEPSPTAYREAFQLFGNRVLNGEFPGVLDGISALPERFDVLSTMDVLEHIEDPRPFLEALKARLAPGGLVLIKVPSNDGLLFRLLSAVSNSRRNAALSRLWQVDFNYPHWHYYSPVSIRSMLENAGFSVVDERRMPFAFFSTVADRVRSYEAKRESSVALLVKRAVARALVAASYSLRRFDNVVVLARVR